jgi:hypothetical protein
VWKKAILYGREAGTRAVTRSAYAQAGAFFDQALDALAHLPERRETIAQAFDLYSARFGTHVALGFPEQVLACGDRMVSLAEALGDPYRLTLAVTHMGNAL